MFRKVNVTDENIAGQLLLHSMPGRCEPWEKFVSEAERVDLDLIVCLTPAEEIEHKSPDYRGAIQTDDLPCPRMAYPIRDFNAPDDREAFVEFIDEVARELLGGRTLLVHCAAGIGRTGTAAVCLLQQAGLEPDRAETVVNEAGAGASGPAQKKLIDWHAKKVTDGL